MTVCRVCGVELTVGDNWLESLKKHYCNICIDCEKIRVKDPKYKPTILKYNLEHKEEKSDYNKQYIIDNREHVANKRHEYYLENQEELLERERERRKILRHIVISHYSKGTMKCMCPGCNENHYDFLTIDHINNDGSKHRKEIGSNGTVLARWLIDNDFPDGFQVLCMNCNFSKGKHGFCSKHQNKLL